MHSKNYKTMRRNSRKYQPKHLKVDERFSACKITFSMEAFTIAIAIISIFFTLLMKFTIMGEAKEKQIVDTHEIPAYTEGVKIHTVEFTDITSKPFIETGFEVIDIETIPLYEEEEQDDTINEETIIDESIIQEVETIDDQIGNKTIEINDHILVQHDLPSKYYPGLDYSSFQPYMGYDKITNKSAPAYHIVNSDLCYTDEFGLRRYKTNDSQFTIDGADDYVIALGTFYKDKGLVGNRYLIVTSTGMYTAITGDEKADEHTDKMHMFSMHNNGTKAGIIEWIVDQPKLDPDIKRAGTVTFGGPEVLAGEILHIYEIQ